MPRISVNLSTQDLHDLDYICAHNCRSRPEQISRWVMATLSGELVETPRYNNPGDMPLMLTQEQADAAMAAMEPGEFYKLGEDGRSIVNQDGEIVDTLSPEAARMFGRGDHEATDKPECTHAG